MFQESHDEFANASSFAIQHAHCTLCSVASMQFVVLMHTRDPLHVEDFHAQIQLPVFPFLQFSQAWVLAGISDDRRAPLYYGLAALYALPLLRSGFELDSFAIGMLLLGIVHVQVSTQQFLFRTLSLRNTIQHTCVATRIVKTSAVSTWFASNSHLKME